MQSSGIPGWRDKAAQGSLASSPGGGHICPPVAFKGPTELHIGLERAPGSSAPAWQAHQCLCTPQGQQGSARNHPTHPSCHLYQVLTATKKGQASHHPQGSAAREEVTQGRSCHQNGRGPHCPGLSEPRRGICYEPSSGQYQRDTGNPWASRPCPGVGGLQQPAPSALNPRSPRLQRHRTKGSWRHPDMTLPRPDCTWPALPLLPPAKPKPNQKRKKAQLFVSILLKHFTSVCIFQINKI